MPPIPTSPHGDAGSVTPVVLTRKSFANYLARSVVALDRDIALGIVPAPCGRLRRSPRWLRTEIDAWLAAGMPRRDEWERMNALAGRRSK